MKKLNLIGLFCLISNFFLSVYAMEPFSNNIFLYRPRVQGLDKKQEQLKYIKEEPKPECLIYKEEPKPECLIYDDDCTDKQFTVPIAIHYSFANRSFNNCNEKSSLANLIFGKNFIIKDIYLFSKLSSEGKISNSMANGSLGPERGMITLEGEEFGAYQDDFFTTLIAPTEVVIDAEQREFAVDASFVYRFVPGGWQRAYWTVGFTIPFKNRLHIMDCSLIGGALRSSATDPGLDVMLCNFFQQVTGIKDFFLSGILAQKGIAFEQRQSKTGIGDVNLFAFVDFAAVSQHLDAMQTGLNLVIPSGGKQNPDTVWDLVLGNGGAFQVELFANALFRTSSAALNPNIRLVGQFSAPFASRRRVPKCKQQDEERVALTPALARSIELIVPQAFQNGFFIDAFQDFDTSVLELADQAVRTRTRYGSRLILGLGNYFYDVFKVGFRLGVLYEFMYKAKDSVCLKKKTCGACDSGIFNTKFLESSTKQQAHTIAWELAYKFDNLVELTMGSQHVIAGRNVPRNQEIFASLTAAF
ncbi:MAG: hypothetical protein WCD44_01110 [Candidatus Babeliales bacterium]